MPIGERSFCWHSKLIDLVVYDRRRGSNRSRFEGTKGELSKRCMSLTISLSCRSSFLFIGLSMIQMSFMQPISGSCQCFCQQCVCQTQYAFSRPASFLFSIVVIEMHSHWAGWTRYKLCRWAVLGDTPIGSGAKLMNVNIYRSYYYFYRTVVCVCLSVGPLGLGRLWNGSTKNQ